MILLTFPGLEVRRFDFQLLETSCTLKRVWPLWAKQRGVISYGRDPRWRGLLVGTGQTDIHSDKQGLLFFDSFLRFSDSLGQWPTLKTAVVWDHCCFCPGTHVPPLCVSLSGSLCCISVHLRLPLISSSLSLVCRIQSMKNTSCIATSSPVILRLRYFQVKPYPQQIWLVILCLLF